MADTATEVKRARNGFSAVAFAHAVGATVSTLYRWESGETRPTSEAHIRALVQLGADEATLRGKGAA